MKSPGVLGRAPAASDPASPEVLAADAASSVDSAMAEVAATHNVVVLGSGGQFLFAKVAAALHVQIVAPLPYRIARVMRLAKTDKPGAEKIIEERDRAKEIFIRALYGNDWRDPASYDLVLNIDHFSNEMAVEIIVKAAQAKGIEVTAVVPE